MSEARARAEIWIIFEMLAYQNDEVKVDLMHAALFAMYGEYYKVVGSVWRLSC